MKTADTTTKDASAKSKAGSDLSHEERAARNAILSDLLKRSANEDRKALIVFIP